MPSVFVFGEPLAELSDIRPGQARLGVAGDAFNTAVYMARAGALVEMVAAIGADPLSAEAMRVIAEEGIGATHVARHPNRPIGLYAIETDEAGERSFTYWRSQSAFRAWFETEGCEDALARMAQADLLYLSGISLSVFAPPNRQRIVDLARTVRRAGGKVAFDPNYRPMGWESQDAAREAVSALMPFVSIALPTLEDETALFGFKRAQNSVAAWVNAGAEEVCVKCGPKGAFLSDHGWVAPDAVRRPLDTTGAGDSFNGAYLAARLIGATPSEAARAGNAQAGEVVMVRGALIPNDHQPTPPPGV